MEITRHNYEEFFLLLADGELSPAQEEAVLQFTKQHPDLADELDMMMECRLDAEIPPIFPKEKLLKPVMWNVDAPDEIQLQLLALLDNELAEDDKIALEKKINSDVALQLEWQILLAHTKLEAEKASSFPKEKILKPTIWNVDEPDTVYVQMMALLDDELSGKDKLDITQKIANSKALEIEWQSLQKARLEATSVIYPKAKLIKSLPWNIDAPETIYVQMMALLDNELPVAEKLELEQKIAVDFTLQNEWKKLQNAKLNMEAIIFPNKELLYRQKEPRRIGGWVRWAAAAAVVLGFGLSLLSGNINNPAKELATNTNNVADKSVTNPATPSSEKSISVNEKIASQKNNNQIENEAKETVLPTTPINTASTENTAKKNNNSNNSIINKTNASQKNNIAVKDRLNTTTGITIASNNTNNYEQETVTTSTRNIITGSVDTELENQDINPGKLNTSANDLLAKNTYQFRTASYTDDISDNNTDDDVVYIAGARLNKQKVRGVFRGITRSLGRTFSKSKVEPENETPALIRSLKP